MPLIKCPDCGKEFSTSAAACPNCGRPNKPASRITSIGLLGTGCLTVILFALIGSLIGQHDSPTTGPTPSAPPTPSASSGSEGVSSGPQLELESWNWHTEYGYAILEGRVKNISSQSLENVEAVATFLTKGGSFITSDDALIDFNPILPGQTSSFKVMATENPEMKTASVTFKTLMGGTINWRERQRTK